MADSLPFEVEFDLRLVGCELIQTTGRLLKLPQTAMATAQVLFHRYYYIKSFVKNPMEFYAMASVFLSSKIEECPRRIRDVMNVFHHIKQVRSGKMIKPMVVDETYYDTKNQVIKAERRMLKELGFCIHVKHPHKIIFIYLQAMECSQLELSQKAWNFMNDSLRTDIFLRYSPENIVCACIYLSARELKIPLPQSPPWFTAFGADEESMKEICVRILHIYQHKTKSADELEKVIVECNLKLNEEKRRIREEKSKTAALSVAASIATNPRNSSEIHPDEKKHDTDSSRSKTKFTGTDLERVKFPHQHRSGISTPTDQIPLLSHSNNPNPNPISRHASFNYPYNASNNNGTIPIYPHPSYPYQEQHYQNENYYEIRKNKSSNDLIGSSHYNQKSLDSKRSHSRSRSRNQTESSRDINSSKISNQTNRIKVSRSRSRSPWKKEKALDRKERVERGDAARKTATRTRSRSNDSVDSDRSSRESSSKHKKVKKSSSRHGGDGGGGRREEGRGREDKGRDARREKERERSGSGSRQHKSSGHHHKSSKSSKSSSGKEHEGEGNRYVPIYS